MAEEVSVIEYMGTPIARLDRYSGSDDEYQEVVSWTVTEGYEGVLHEISMVSTNYSKTHFKLVIAGVTQFEDKLIQSALSLPWKDNKLASESQVILYAKSTDGTTSITVDGSITGKEWTGNR